VFAGRNADQAVDCGQQSTGRQRVAHSACFGQRRDRPQEVSGTGWRASAVYRGATGRCFLGGSERQLTHPEIVEDEQGYSDQELHVLFAGAVESGVGQLVEQSVSFPVEHAVTLLNRGLSDGLG